MTNGLTKDEERTHRILNLLREKGFIGEYNYVPNEVFDEITKMIKED